MIEFEDPEENKRTYEGYTLIRTNPFGFWVIRTEKGRLPDALSGSYTDPQRAVKDIQVYLANHKEKKK